MKKIIFIMLVLALIPVMAQATTYDRAVLKGNTAIAAGHKYSAATMEFVTTDKAGCYAFHGDLEGSGVAEVYYEVYLNSTLGFVRPEGVRSLTYNWTATSGPNSDGEIFIFFDIGLNLKARIVIEEIGDASTVTPTYNLAWVDGMKANTARGWQIIQMPTIITTLASAAYYTGGTQVLNGYWDMSQMGAAGYITFDCRATAGTGTYSVSYRVSNDGTTFTEPSDVVAADDVASDISTTNSDVVQITPISARFIQAQACNTSLTDVTLAIYPTIVIRD